MIVKILAHALQVDDGLDPDRAQMIRLADTRQHQQLCRLEGARAGDQLPPCMGLSGL